MFEQAGGNTLVSINKLTVYNVYTATTAAAAVAEQFLGIDTVVRCTGVHIHLC